MLLTGGKILAADKSYVVGALVVQNQDTGAVTVVSTKDDGGGGWSMPAATASDFTLIVSNPSLKCEGMTFHLSEWAKSPGVTYDPVAGTLEIDLPFV